MMRFNRSKIAGAVTAALLLPQAVTVHAQNAPSQNASSKEVEEVVVTGSRIAHGNIEAATPVTELTTEELLSSGVTSIGDTLNDLPALRSTFTSANSTRFIGTAGVNFLDLRGLGEQRTLVLVNGRRHVAGTDGALTVDTNTIPADLLERVDVVTGGASSIYGSDAVAGVVSFVLKQNYEGFRTQAQTGMSAESDNNNSFISFTAGHNFWDNRANIAGSVEWAREEAFTQADREETAKRQLFIVSSADPTGVSSDGIPDRTFTRDVHSVNLTEGGVFIPSFQVGAAGVPAALRTRPENGQPRIFNFNPDGTLAELNYGTRDYRPFASNSDGGNGTTLRRYGDMTPDIERVAVNLIGHLDFTDAVTLFGEAKFVQTDTLAFLPAGPSFNQTVSASAPAATGSAGLVVRLDNPFLTTQARSLIAGLLPAGATQFTLNRNNLDIGVRGEDTSRKTVRGVLGLRGDITDHVNYEVSLNYGQLDVHTDVLNNRFERNLRLAIDAARAADGTIVCRSRLNGAGAIVTSGDPVIDSCVPANVLGDGNVSQGARDYINADSTFDATVEQQVANAFVSYDTGAWFNLPGGPVGAAIGAEYRKESSESGYSDDVEQGLTFLNAIQPLDEEYSVKEAFVEMRFPLLANLPFAKELTFNGSYRAADYSLENTTTVTAWNGGLQWAPIDDVRVRASVGQSVRAPTLGDLFQPLTQNFATVRDPCDVTNVSSGSPTRAANCAAAGIPAGFVNNLARSQTTEIRSGGNPGLTEESSRSFTLGTVLQPRFVPNLQIIVDYYDIDIDHVIASVTAQQIVDNCYDAASLDNIFCPLVFRDPATNLFFQNGNGPIGGGILQSTLNYASRKARGVDTEIDYSFQWEGVGAFNARFLGTYVRQRDNFPFLDQPNRADQLLEELGDPKYAFNFDLGYRRDNLAIKYGMRWLESQYVDFIENIRSVSGLPPQNPDFSDIAWTGSVMYHDLRVEYSWSDSIDVFIGVDNISDEMPPLGLTGVGAGSSIYDNTGRFFYGGLKWRL
jgi:outer membrane receptor protein involved in Fe transport